MRAHAQRYRIIYKIDTPSKLVTILALGLRREGDRADIYDLAQRLIRRGFLLLITLLLIDVL